MTTSDRPSDPNQLAVLHAVGDAWRAVVADTRGPSPALKAHRAFAASEAGAMEAWLDLHAVGPVICVLPASSIICRTCVLPNAEAAQLQQALELQAETHFPNVVPYYRLGMAVVDAAAGETNRSGIIVAWPQKAQIAPPPTTREVTYAPDIAALAALLDGFRPSQPIVWADRNNGAVALAITHANGAAFRAAREHDPSTEKWAQGIGRLIAETALNAGHSAGYVESLVSDTKAGLSFLHGGDAALLLPDEVKTGCAGRLDGAPNDADWWAVFGIAAGIVLARTGELNSLTWLRENEPIEQPTLVDAVIRRLNDARTARILVIACVLLVGLGPLAFNGVRLGLLKLRYSDIDQQLAEVNDARDQLAMYKELKERSTPMTKLLADIACNTPIGIELETMRIAQQDESFTVSGRADPAPGGQPSDSLVTQMQEQLRDTRIFDDLKLNWGDRDFKGSVQFDLSGHIAQAYTRPRYSEELDFGLWTFQDRRDGEPAPSGQTADEEMLVSAEDKPVRESPRPREEERPADAPPVLAAAPPTAPSSGGGGRIESIRPHSGGDGDGLVPGEAVGSTVNPNTIPQPLTQAQINAMTDAEIKQSLREVASARKAVRNSGDEELRARLKNEWDMLLEKAKASRQ